MSKLIRNSYMHVLKPAPKSLVLVEHVVPADQSRKFTLELRGDRIHGSVDQAFLVEMTQEQLRNAVQDIMAVLRSSKLES